MSRRNNNKNKSKKGLIVLVFLAVCIMAVSVVLAVKLQSKDILDGVNGNIDINNPQSSGFSAGPAEAQTLYPFGNRILKVTASRISILDMNGDEVFGEAVSLETPLSYVKKEKAIIIDTGGVSYITIDTRGKMKTLNASSTLDFGHINRDGYVVTLMDEPDVKGVAHVTDPDGNDIFTWRSAQSGYILYGSVSPDSRYADLSIINTDGAHIQPVLRRFSIEGEAVAQFIPESEELLPFILYDKDNDPVLAGQTRIIGFDNAGVKFSASFNRIYTINYSDYGILAVAREQVSDIPSLYIIDTSGEKHLILELSEEVTPIAVMEDYAAVGYGNTVVCIDLRRQTEISRHYLSASAIRTDFAGNKNNIIVVARDGVTTFPVR